MMNDIIDYLTAYASEHNIDCIWVDGSPDYFPCSSTKDRVILMNRNWSQRNTIPFALGHEIGHIMHNDCHLDENVSERERMKMEYAADQYAIGLLSGYAFKHNIDFESTRDFYCAFGIPLTLITNCL